MKKLFLAALTLAVLGCVAVSCSEKIDNENPSGGKNENPSNSPEDNLPDESRLFVGFWDGDPQMYLAPNGRCFVTYWSATGKGNTQFGFWTYNKETNILATTISAYQFNVTLSNEQSWAGIFRSGDKTYSRAYTRGDNVTFLEALMYSHVNLERIDDSDYDFSPYSPMLWYYEDNNEDDFTFIYKSSTDEKISGTVVLENVENLPDMTFEFKRFLLSAKYRLSQQYFK